MYNCFHQIKITTQKIDIKIDVKTFKDKASLNNMLVCTMSNGEIDINNININNINMNQLNKLFEGIDFGNNKKVNNCNESQCEVLTKCFSCQSSNILEDYCEGIVVCTDCGQVLDNLYDNKPEWKQFDDDDKNNGRCTTVSNPLLFQSSLGTTIEGYGKSKLKRLQTWSAMPYRERSLNKEFKKINMACQKGNILKCAEDDAKIICKYTYDRKHKEGKQMGKYVITRRTKRTSINAGCIKIACLKNGISRTSKEIAILFDDLKESEVNQGCKEVLKALRHKLNVNMGTSKSEHFIKRYCNKLKIMNAYTEKALEISQNIDKLNIASGHTPYSVAAASILLMVEIFDLKSVTKKKIAREFGLSAVTIGKTHKELEKYKPILLKREAIDNIVKQINNDLTKQEIPNELKQRMIKFGILKNENTESEKNTNFFDGNNANALLKYITYKNSKILKAINDSNIFL